MRQRPQATRALRRFYGTLRLAHRMGWRTKVDREGKLEMWDPKTQGHLRYCSVSTVIKIRTGEFVEIGDVRDAADLLPEINAQFVTEHHRANVLNIVVEANDSFAKEIGDVSDFPGVPPQKIVRIRRTIFKIFRVNLARL